MARQWKGRTELAGSAILGAAFWDKARKGSPGEDGYEPGTTVKGAFLRGWMSSAGECYEFAVVPGQPKPEAYLDSLGKVVEKGSPGSHLAQLDKFSIGALKGLGMALQDLLAQGYDGFKFRDIVEFECTGFQEQSQSQGPKDKMVMFEIRPFRP